MNRTHVWVALLGLELILFLVSLPGFGIETRSFTSYAAWAGPIFLVLTLLVFGLGLAGIAVVWRNPRRSAQLGAGMAVAAVVTVLFDLSHVAGPPDPPGPLVLSVFVIIVSAGVLFLSITRPTAQAPASAA
ncbi:MAG TPA: hypothetical protein VJQ43_02010 [Thermoplasmata archaeon]|nr:hypothetical protein [Thermoplasmata archaeon]